MVGFTFVEVVGRVGDTVAIRINPDDGVVGLCHDEYGGVLEHFVRIDVLPNRHLVIFAEGVHIHNVHRSGQYWPWIGCPGCPGKGQLVAGGDFIFPIVKNLAGVAGQRHIDVATNHVTAFQQVGGVAGRDAVRRIFIPPNLSGRLSRVENIGLVAILPMVVVDQVSVFRSDDGDDGTDAVAGRITPTGWEFFQRIMDIRQEILAANQLRFHEFHG